MEERVVKTYPSIFLISFKPHRFACGRAYQHKRLLVNLLPGSNPAIGTVYTHSHKPTQLSISLRRGTCYICIQGCSMEGKIQTQKHGFPENFAPQNIGISPRVYPKISATEIAATPSTCGFLRKLKMLCTYSTCPQPEHHHSQHSLIHHFITYCTKNQFVVHFDENVCQFFDSMHYVLLQKAANC